MKKAILVCGGIVNNPSWLYREINRLHDEDIIIYAVDSGANILADIDIVPDILVGDSDSIYPGVKKDLIRKKVEVLSYRPEKDNTDTDLALRHAVDNGVDEVIFYAATGGRQDHFIANLFMLEVAEELGLHATIKDEINSICYMSDNCSARTFDFSGYKYCSLLPLSDRVEGIKALNLKYPVDELTLLRNSSLGVSNEFVTEENILDISKKSGRLFIVASNDRK